MSEFNAIPADIEKFFETGELPTSLAPAPAAVVEPPPVAAPAPAAVAEPEPPQTPVVQQPNAEAYLEQLRQFEKERADSMEKQLKEMQDKLAALTMPQAPDVEKDPLGHLLHEIKTMREKVEAMQQGEVQKTQQTQTERMQQQFIQSVHASIEEFSKTNTDYQQAYQHLRTSRLSDLTSSGYSNSEANAMLNQEEFNISLRAVQSGKNPAEIAYNMAKRYGYAPQAKPADPESKVEQIKKGLKADSVPAGKPTTADISVEAAKDASDKDLNNMVENSWEKMFGVPDKGSIF